MLRHVAIPTISQKCLHRRGAVLVLSMMILSVMAAFAVSFAAISRANLQIPKNQHKVGCARDAAESGLAAIRYLLNGVYIPGTNSPTARLSYINSHIQDRISQDQETYGETSTLSSFLTLNNSYVVIPPVTLDSSTNDFFWAYMTQPDINTLRIYVEGWHKSGDVRRAIQLDWEYDETANSVFDFGVATKGPLSLQGKILLDGVNLSVESNIYIESYNDLLALEITNSQIGGTIKIANPIPIIDIQGGQASVGGESGEDALDNIYTDVPCAQFPTPDANVFKPYATTVFDISGTSTDAVLENVYIPANTNPKFSGQTVIRGVMLVETPNIIEFQGGVDITGVIVGDGDMDDDSATNQMIFGGNVASDPVDALPDETQYEGLEEQQGTFIMAPGFALSFSGSFETLSGAIVGNGITFSGSAGGTIAGSVINYSDSKMEISGSTDLFFNRSGLEGLPAGFVPHLSLKCKPSSYTEPTISGLFLSS
ncbi:hypothetical protein ACFL3F_00790 [Planctomycetota bacterium]